jgi:hypothetical protein
MKTCFGRLVLGAFFQVIVLMGYSQFTLGPKVSVNFSNVLQKTEMSTGFNAGVFFRLGKSFYFQPELLYSFRSSTLKKAVGELKENLRLKNHYLDIPLLLGYKFVNNSNFKFRVFIGPRLGILIANNVKIKRKPIEKIQFGGRTGIGIDFWRFTLDVSYDFSANKHESVSEGWIKQNMLNIALGFKIFTN